MACLRTLTALSSMGVLLACGSRTVDPPAASQHAVQVRATSRATLRRGASASIPDPLANTDARSAEARRSPALRAPAFEWAVSAAPGRAARAAVAAPRDAVEAARRFLGLSTGLAAVRAPGAGALDETVVTGVHDLGRGPVVVQLRRRVAGLDVFGQTTAVALTRGLEPVARTGAPVSPDRAAPTLRPFALGAADAMAAALADLTGEAYGPADLVTVQSRGGYDRADLAPASASSRAERLVAPARARKVLFPLRGELVPAYRVEVALRRAGRPLQGFAYVISAEDGSVLVRRNQVQHEFSYLVWADPVTLLPHDGPQGLAGTPYPGAVPNGWQAATVEQSLVTLDGFPFSRNDPWLSPDATFTVGNNAEAYADLAPPDGYTEGEDMVGSISDPGEFAWPYDFAAEPNQTGAQIQAAITQLFYDVNFFHDWYYDSGFDEVSGNAQYDNGYRGGVEGDPLVAQAQDWEGTDNANMWTPGDGVSPVMQMFLWTSTGRSHVEVTAPAAIAGTLAAHVFVFGPASFEASGQVVAAQPADACSPITNAASLADRIALIDRGTCDLSEKVKAAQGAGAIGAIIRNVTPSQAFEALLGGADPDVSIPSLLVSLQDGATLAGQLGAGVTATLYRQHVPQRDGTIDNLVVAHEWGHYISNRLVGDGGGLDSIQAGGLGEGWGDTHALLLAVREEDVDVAANAEFGGTYALAGWVMGGLAPIAGGSQGYYFGTRRVPYSTDLTKDPLTFIHIGDGNRLVPEGSTIPVAFGADGADNSEVHNTGEVWATMLWECYAALLRDTLGDSPRLTFADAQGRWKDYLVAAYKLTPLNPTLLEARDALLAAAYAGDRRDYGLFWQAFAKRGAGVKAVGPDRWLSLDNNPVVEDYSADPHLSPVSVAFQAGAGSCSDGDAVLDVGERGALLVQLRNDGVSSIPAAQAVPSGTGLSFPGGAVEVPASAAGDVVTVAVPVALPKAPSASERRVVLTFPETAPTVGFTVEVPVAVNLDRVPGASAADAFPGPDLAWKVDGWFGDRPGWRLSADGAWAEGTSGASDLKLVSPDLVVGDEPFRISISHRYMFDTDGDGNFWDGGVIELSADGGQTWTDVGGAVYDGELASDPVGTNPLGGRPAFTFLNPSYPDFDAVALDLATEYAGKTVNVRFRMGSDGAVGWGGWTLHRVSFAGITDTPFTAVQADAGKCANASATGGGGGGGCATGGGVTLAAALLALAALMFPLRRSGRGRAGAVTSVR